MNENKRMRRVRSGRVIARFAVIASLVFGARAMAVVTVKVATDSGARGGALHLTLSVTHETIDGSLASLNTDVIFDTAQLDLVGECATSSAACRTTADCGADDFCRFAPTVCVKDPRLIDQTVEVLPPDFQNVQPGKRRMRFAIVATRLPVPTFTDGTLVTCTFQIAADAPVGPVTLSTDRLQVADNSIPAKPLAAQIVIEPGQITSEPAPTATGSRNPTGTPPSATPTIGGPTATVTSGGATITPTGGTPTAGSPTPTSKPGQCNEPRPAPAGPAVYVADQNVSASGDITVEVKLAAGGQMVAGTQNDLVFDANVTIKTKANGKPDCAVNPDINKAGTSFGFRPPGCSGAACTGVRALVLATDNTDPIPDGSSLYTCHATLTATATLDNEGVIFSDPNGERIAGATGREGILCIGVSGQSPTPTPTGQGGTPTAMPSPSARPSSTPTTRVPTVTPTKASTTVPSATRSSTPTNGGSGSNESGGGCNCSINAADQASTGLSSFWLSAAPIAMLLWRRRRPRG